ncbi:MAG: glycine cleavage T C-terminal barrel domain-containing protein [Gemmatimonadaceae bacterium]
MTLADEVHAIRHGVALSRLEHVRYLRVTGARAFEALDRVVSGPLRVRDGQLMHSLLLSDDARPFADIYLARDDEEFFLLAEGPSAADLVDHLRRHFPADGSVSVEDCTTTFAILGLDGPYAWELLGATIDPEVIGLPYLTFYHHRSSLCYRAGKTGEYGYGMIVPQAEASALEARMRAVGEAFDLQTVGLDALDQCALENWFFNIRREGREQVTPIELQLQWRVSYKKHFVGSEALTRRRADGALTRLTCIIADGTVAVGDSVFVDGDPIGRVVNAGYSDSRKEWVALALIDIGWAYPGIDCTSAPAGSTSSFHARTISPPVLQNRSLAVSPQLHSYSTRAEYPFPPLVSP